VFHPTKQARLKSSTLSRDGSASTLLFLTPASIPPKTGISPPHVFHVLSTTRHPPSALHRRNWTATVTFSGSLSEKSKSSMARQGVAAEARVPT
jgi:hypothetical protein